MIVVKEGSKNDNGPGSHRRTGAAGVVAMAVDHANGTTYFYQLEPYLVPRRYHSWFGLFLETQDLNMAETLFMCPFGKYLAHILGIWVISPVFT